jgi:cysteinyl-tRNA synthetase
VLERGEDGASADNAVLDRFREAMDDDFDTPKALGVLFEAVREANRRADAGETAGPLVASVGEMVDVLGIRPVAAAATDDDLDALQSLAAGLGLDLSVDIDALLDAIVTARTEARTAKDFDTSDRIRDRLAEVGITIEDTADGSRWIRR